MGSAGARHHHHVRFKSHGGQDTLDNLILLCPICHADIHAYRLAIIGDDANGVLRFARDRAAKAKQLKALAMRTR